VKINALLFFLFLLSACGTKIAPPETSASIPVDKMQQILKDIHVADGLANREGEKSGATEALTKSYYLSVFEKHQVKEEDFYQSMRFYMYEANLLDSIYANVIIEISKEQAVVQGE